VFAEIAAWQFASFLLLMLLVWANEFLSLTSRVFGMEPRPFDYFRGAVLSAFVILTAIINVGHSYLQQKKILSGLITVCSHCHKVKIRSDAWEEIEVYVANQSDATFSHGLCPACYKVQVGKLDRPDATPGRPPTGSIG
jgi:hypothetical protein